LQMVMRVMEKTMDLTGLNKLRKGEWKVVAPSEGKYVIKGSYQDSYFELVVKLKRLVEEYTDFNINGVKVKLPYYQTVGTRYGGKSTPEQIRNFILVRPNSRVLQMTLKTGIKLELTVRDW